MAIINASSTFPNATEKTAEDPDNECIRRLDYLYHLVREKLGISMWYAESEKSILINGHLTSESIDNISSEAAATLSNLESACKIAENLLKESQKNHGTKERLIKKATETIRSAIAAVFNAESPAEIESISNWNDRLYQLRMEFLITLLKMARHHKETI